jgi:phytoene dehydrogenase-like protein
VRDYTVSGVALESGEEIEATAVVSTADPKRTLLELVDPQWLDPDFLLAARNIKLRGSTAYVCFAAKGRLDHSTQQGYTAPVSLAGDMRSLERAADAAKYGTIAEDPFVEFFVPSQRWGKLAPEGHQVIVARIPWAPYALRSGEWDYARREMLERAATRAIERVIPKFGGSVVHTAVLAPPDVEDHFGVSEGALTQGELTLDQILFMRPVPGWGHHEMPIERLYLGGAGAHPGPGVLGGAGLLAARRLLSSRA